MFSPNALGAILDRGDRSRRSNVPIVAGGANNQLATPEDGARLHERGILYAPDYVINAGGIINVSTEYLGDGDREPGARADRGDSRPARADLGGKRRERPRPGGGRRRHGAAADRPRLIEAAQLSARRDYATMHGYANPARFLKIARPATAWLLGSALCCSLRGLVGGLTSDAARLSPGRDRAHPLHPRSRRLARHGRLGGDRAPASIAAGLAPSARRGRRPRDRAVPGATFAALCLATGSIWGRPTWGTWWEWDGRMTSMLVLFFLYLGYIALAAAERSAAGKGGSPPSSAWSARSTCRSSIIRCCGGARSTRARASASTRARRSRLDAVAAAAAMLGFTAAVRRGRADADARRARRSRRSRRGCSRMAAE